MISSFPDNNTSAGTFEMRTSDPDVPAENSSDDGDLVEMSEARKPTRRLARLLSTMAPRQREGEYEYLAITERDDNTDGPPPRSRPPPREVRRGRKSYVLGHVKRVVIATPVVVLMLFGVLHLLQVLVSRANLLWNADDLDDFLPNWGKPGHDGQGLANYPTDATRDVLPIPCHSHNDYWRRIPLFDALHWGCTSVEADVWLLDDEELYVGHNLASLTKNRTFTSLYVNPLVELLDHMNQNTSFSNTTGHGVFDVDPSQTLVLLVDFKTDGHDLFPVVEKQLEALREKEYLSYWDGATRHSRAITVVGTGNTPFDLLVKNTTYRDIFFDAPLEKLWQETPPLQHEDTGYKPPLNPDLPPTTIPQPTTDDMTPRAQGQTGTTPSLPASTFNQSNSHYASVSFTSTIGFVWRGHLSLAQMTKIRGQILGARNAGLKARYWNTPSWPVDVRNHIWHVLMREGADVLNVDDLEAAARRRWRGRGVGVHGLW
ncbi:hypothetical protein LTR62_000093 [Meristemomyces frigidus]|uniref:Altered inheritance of mitochondria protein 6 n=1 Tax=Meristemomyces frigidus TaxID=1508187 RepID=A0AAN7TIJ8_9PEZI|nr:hypothetical protein LTR62_000093 [Meristemomyces frigidus]